MSSSCQTRYCTERAAVIASLALCLASLAGAQTPAVHSTDANKAGQTIYARNCATCHDKPVETKSPPLDTLKRMGPRAVSYALTHGKMKAQGAALSSRELDNLVSWLAATADVDNSWIAQHSCAADRRKVDTGPPTVGQWGIDPHNNRRLTAQQSGLTTADMRSLELAWVMAFPQTANMRAQPVIVGNTMYLAIVDSGQLFALDIGGTQPCVKWVYEHDVPLRTALGYHRLPDGRHVLLFADAATHVIMMDAVTPKVIWTATVKVTSVSNVTAMPVLYQDKVFVPISSGELNMGAAPEYECCTSHGAVVALDARTGKRRWVYHTMQNAVKTTVSRVGTQQHGPSGAPIWTAAAIDEKRRLIYVGTGQNTSAPATDTSDAILAIRMDSGRLAWKYQTTPNDIFLTGCMNQPDGPNCPPASSINKDWDFGAGLMLARTPSGRELVVAGQKSGVVWALDPDSGKPVWNTKVGGGGAMGGIHWGMAYDGSTLFAPNNMSTGPTADEVSPGLSALDIETGRINWKYLHQPDCSGTRRQELRSCDSSYGMSAAALLVDGAVVQGTNDGFVKIFDSRTGEVLFSFNTARAFETVNGVQGSGGAIDNANVVAGNGMLFVQSGYGLMGVPGNLLLAFRPASLSGRLRDYALMQTLNAELLASRSATATLRDWCGRHHLAETPEIIAEVQSDSTPATPEQRARLQVTADEPIVYRKVRLRCGTRLMSEAENWYVPGRLTVDMNRQLEGSQAPFGRVIESLEPYRRNFQMQVHWQLPEGHQQPSSGSPAMFEHRAIVYTSGHQPLAEVREIYQSAALP